MQSNSIQEKNPTTQAMRMWRRTINKEKTMDGMSVVWFVVVVIVIVILLRFLFGVIWMEIRLGRKKKEGEDEEVQTVQFSYLEFIVTLIFFEVLFVLFQIYGVIK